jgi:hypothetical protein
MIADSDIARWRKHIKQKGDDQTGEDLFVLLCLNDIDRLRAELEEAERHATMARQATLDLIRERNDAKSEIETLRQFIQDKGLGKPVR